MLSLLQVGYPCLSLHGGKDQSDRESTINDFKTDVCSLLIATGVAARGLDVKELVLVVNYDTPNHHEEYVHRVGRTGKKNSWCLPICEPGCMAMHVNDALGSNCPQQFSAVLQEVGLMWCEDCSLRVENCCQHGGS